MVTRLTFMNGMICYQRLICIDFYQKDHELGIEKENNQNSTFKLILFKADSEMFNDKIKTILTRQE